MMLTVKEAESIILNLVHPLKDTEVINLETAVGRVLAQSVISHLDFPYWDNSAMDGYAVRYEDVKTANPQNPVILEIIEKISAGKQPKKVIQPGQAARIFTGAMMPKGADTIVIQENTQKADNTIHILASPEAPKAFVRHQGAFYQAGNPLLLPGILLNAPEIAVLATAQCTKLTVYRRPRVAIFSTGDELVAPSETLQPGQIVDSNQYALAAFVDTQGAIPLPLGIVSDRPEKLKQVITQAIESADVVLSTGGVSVGDYDYIEEILAELGGEIHIRSVAVKPGKPLTVATFANGCLYFGIPGNPVSALVSCWRFVQSALKKLSGLNHWQPTFIKVKTHHSLSGGGQRESYLWGQIRVNEGFYEFYLAAGSQNSANLINLAQTNALAFIPIGQKVIEAGELVEVMLIG